MLSWFACPAASWNGDADTRTDRYLDLPDCRYAGIKLREGRFEVKALQKDVGFCVFAAGLAGQVQRWVKWTTDSLATAGGVGRFVPEDRWVTIVKQRLLREFVIDDAGLFEVQPGGDNPPAEGHVELTRITRAESPQNWLTLGFEVSSAAGDRGALLSTLVQAFLDRQPVCPQDLLQADSRSYPDWLAARSG
jgi:hypothetical protein